MPSKLKELVIRKSKWWRGKNYTEVDPGYGSSALRLPNGKMCCLGFLGKACGFTDAELLGKSFPRTTHYSLQDRWPRGLIGAEEAVEGSIFKTGREDNIGQINDTPHLSDEERAKELAPLFAKLGYKLKFIP
jgi:hypothetical protein